MFLINFRKKFRAYRRQMDNFYSIFSKKIEAVLAKKRLIYTNIFSKFYIGGPLCFFPTFTKNFASPPLFLRELLPDPIPKTHVSFLYLFCLVSKQLFFVNFLE